MLTDNNNDINKPAGCEQFIGEICRMQLKGDNRAISGKVILVDKKFLTIEHKDGRHSLIRIEQLNIISILRPKVV